VQKSSYVYNNLENENVFNIPIKNKKNKDNTAFSLQNINNINFVFLKSLEDSCQT